MSDTENEHEELQKAKQKIKSLEKELDKCQELLLTTQDVLEKKEKYIIRRQREYNKLFAENKRNIVESNLMKDLLSRRSSNDNNIKGVQYLPYDPKLTPINSTQQMNPMYNAGNAMQTSSVGFQPSAFCSQRGVMPTSCLTPQGFIDCTQPATSNIQHTFGHPNWCHMH